MLVARLYELIVQTVLDRSHDAAGIRQEQGLAVDLNGGTAR